MTRKHRYTEDDYNEAREAWERINSDYDPDGLREDGGEGSEIIMLSTGYAEVWLDGDVVQHGTVIFNVAD